MNDRVAYKRIGGAEAIAMDRVIRELTHSPNISDSVARIISLEGQPNSTEFENYAAMTLRNAGGLRLSTFKRASMLKILEPENGRLSQIVQARSFPKALEPIVLSVECALNRLVCIADAITDGICGTDDSTAELRRSISILGGGFISTSSGWRSAHVKLPAGTSPARVSAAYYNEVDWRSTDCVANNARAIFQHCIRPNAYLTSLGMNVDAQSDWDVRTRLAQFLRALELPHRYSFRFDYDCGTKTVAAVFTCPPQSFLPAIGEGESGLGDSCGNPGGSRGNPGGSRGNPDGPRNSSNSPNVPSKSRAYESYLLRLACLFAAACFGSGRDIRTAMVAGYNSTWSQPLVSMSFDRKAFSKSVLEAVDSYEFSDPALRFDPNAIVDMIDATHLDWLGRTGSRGAQDITLPPLDLSLRRMDPWLDERELPQDAQALFHCKRVCDIDTAHYLGGHADAVDLARADSEESPLAAIMRLESLVEELEAACEKASTQSASPAPARPLYAAHPLTRLAIDFLGDELSVADQAAAFLQEKAAELRDVEGDSSLGDAPAQEGVPAQGSLPAQGGLPVQGDATSPRSASSLGNTPAPEDIPMYFRAPDALYHARFGLSDLYQSLGDFHGAESQANRCIALAPTTAGAYYRKADVLAEQGRYREAANVLIAGLRHSALRSDCALLYYHLGMLFWNLDMKAKAAAVHVYNMSMEGEYAERSRQIVLGLRKQDNAPSIVHTASAVAARELEQAQLPVAPMDMRDHVAQATIILANANMTAAAVPYARELEAFYGNDEIVVSACRSIQYGVALN